jgi:hypothetical protein
MSGEIQALSALCLEKETLIHIYCESTRIRRNCPPLCTQMSCKYYSGCSRGVGVSVYVAICPCTEMELEQLSLKRKLK